MKFNNPLYKKVATLCAACSLFVATVVSTQICFILFHQPEEPESLRVNDF